jgi:hypothetical protein
VVVDNPVEHRVQIVQQVHHLQRRASRCKFRELHDIGEEDRDAIERLGLHRLTELQLVGHLPESGNLSLLPSV